MSFTSGPWSICLLVAHLFFNEVMRYLNVFGLHVVDGVVCKVEVALVVFVDCGWSF